MPIPNVARHFFLYLWPSGNFWFPAMQSGWYLVFIRMTIRRFSDKTTPCPNMWVGCQGSQLLNDDWLSFYGPLSRTTWVSRYQKKHSPTHTYPDHQSSFICFLHLLRSMASSLFNLRAWQSFCTSSGLPLGLASSTSYSIQFFTHWFSSFHNTCPYQL